MKKVVIWILRIVPAIIMVQTLFFKFSGAEESIYIFSTIGMEPWGRYVTGVGELVASVLILVPAMSWLGSAMGVGLMSGAVFFHLTILGIEVKGDGGYLFALAMIVFVACLINLLIEKEQVISTVKKVFNKQ